MNNGKVNVITISDTSTHLFCINILIRDDINQTMKIEIEAK